MSRSSYDVLIIGAGAGGVPAAVRARQLGAGVAVIEMGQVGGVCMNQGCIPAKTLLETARFYHQARSAQPFGLRFSGLEVDLEALMAKKEDTVNYLRLGTESLLKTNGVEIIRGRAVFSGPDRVRVEDREISAQNIILATGSDYAAQGLPGFDTKGVVTPDRVMDLRRIPESVAVLGSGPVELEMAQYLLFMGARVALIEPGKRILPGEEYRELAGRLAKEMKNQGLEILTKTSLKSVEPKGEGLSLTLEKGSETREIQADILVQARRLPRVAGLEPDRAGIELDDEGVRVDEYLRTSNPRIWAIGDATGGPFFSHRAAAMGLAAAENALGRPRPWDPSRLIRGLTTTPEAASVGLTEVQAGQAGYQVLIGNIPYGVNAMAMVRLATGGAVKIVAEAKYGKVLGVHIVGPGATEMIGEAALALEMEATLDELAQGFRYHPSLGESQTDAAREALGRGIYVMR